MSGTERRIVNHLHGRPPLDPLRVDFDVPPEIVPVWRAAKSDETELGIIGALLQMDIINVFDFEVCVMKVVSILTDLQLIDDTVSGYGWMRDHEVIFLPPGSFEQAMTSGTADNLLGEAELTEEP